MLFHVLTLCSVCHVQVHDALQVDSKGCWWILWWWIQSLEGSLGGIRGCSTPGCAVWGWFHTLVHIFHAFLYFEEKTVGWNYGKFGTSVWKNTGSNCPWELIKGNQILWIFTTFTPFMQELINPTGLLAAAPGDHFSPLSHHHPWDVEMGSGLRDKEGSCGNRGVLQEQDWGITGFMALTPFPAITAASPTPPARACNIARPHLF